MRRLVVVLGLTALVAGCGDSADDSGVTQSFRHEVARLKQRTTPAGAISHVTAEPAARSGTADAAWRLDSQLPWPEFSSWARRRLGSEFDVDTSMARVLKGARASATDIYYITLAPDALDSGVVLVHLTALPR